MSDLPEQTDVIDDEEVESEEEDEKIESEEEHFGENNKPEEKEATYTPSKTKKQDNDSDKIKEDVDKKKDITETYVDNVEKDLKKLEILEGKVQNTSDLVKLYFYISELQKIHNSQIKNHHFLSSQYLIHIKDATKLSRDLGELKFAFDGILHNSKNMQISIDGSLEALRYKFQNIIENVELGKIDKILLERLETMASHLPLSELNGMLTSSQIAIKSLSTSTINMEKDITHLQEKIGSSRIELKVILNEVEKTVKNLKIEEKGKMSVFFFLFIIVGFFLGLVGGYFSLKSTISEALVDIKQDNVTLMSEKTLFEDDVKKFNRQKENIQKHLREYSQIKWLEKYGTQKDGKKYLVFPKNYEVTDGGDKNYMVRIPNE